MALIYWLDDDYPLREDASWPLEQRGHSVEHFNKEDDLLSALDDSSRRPDLLIQDLLRSRCTAQVRHGEVRKGANSAYEAGWSLYDEVMRPYFPEIPVLICSHDGALTYNRKRADDFALTLLDKKEATLPGFVEMVQEILLAQRRLHETNYALPSRLLIDLQEVSQELIDHLARHPEEIHQVSWPNFEGLIAELLRRMGYEVSRTPLTRDGGVDLWAVRRDDIAETCYAIDAKKYRKDKVLGPEPVRAIYGVTQMRNANVGMIVTTARFGPEALALASQYRHQISLKDFDAVSEWLRKTRKSEISGLEAHNPALHRAPTAPSRGHRR